MLDMILNKIGLEGALADVGAVFLIVLATLIVAYLTKFILVQTLTRAASRTSTKLDDVVIKLVGPAVVKLVYLVGLGILSAHLDGKYEMYSGDYVQAVDGIVYTLFVVVISMFLIRLITDLTAWYGSTMAPSTESTFDDEVMPVIRRVCSILIVAVSLMIILEHFNIDVKGLIAVLGVGSLAIALAAQETLSNMIAGFVLMVDRPLRKGDRIILGDGTKCDVYEIGMRSTKFLTFENTLVIVPNAQLIKMTINNLSYPEPGIRVKVDVGVAYGSDINEVKELLIAVATEHPNVVKEPPPQAQFREMADSSLNFSLVCRVAQVTQQWNTSLDMREEIYRRLAIANIEIPFPQRVVHLINVKDEKKADGKSGDAKNSSTSLLDRASGDSGNYASLEDGEN